MKPSDVSLQHEKAARVVVDVVRLCEEVHEPDVDVDGPVRPPLVVLEERPVEPVRVPQPLQDEMSYHSLAH